MIAAYTGSQMRAAESVLIDAGAGHALMARAAHGLAHHTLELLRRELGKVYGTRATALIGKGNNGGDALFALSSLAARGVRCTALLFSSTSHDAGLEAFRRAGGRVVPVGRRSRPGSRGYAKRWNTVADELARADVVIDAVLGTGAKGGVDLPPVPPEVLVVACDLPSGVDADTGAAPEGTIRADLTVTFGALKTGLVVGEGHRLAGHVEMVDIGLLPHLPEPDLYVLERSDAYALRPRPDGDVHKYSRGVLGLVAGSDQYPGAAVLAATAAVNTGIGMLRTVSTGSTRALLAQTAPEAVPLDGPDATGDMAGRISAWAVGPGIGEDAHQHAAAAQATAAGKPCVIDASALRKLTPKQGHRHAVLTPHAGELLDLLTRTGLRVASSAIKDDPVRAARWAAVGYSSVVLLKGPSTICVAPDGYTVVAHANQPGLATAGSGDVLTGLIGAFLATHTGPTDPRTLARLAGAAALLHADAARIAGRGGGFGASALARAVSGLDLP